MPPPADRGTLGVVYSPSRVRYPMVRLDWYKNRQNSNRAERGDNRFVRVSWDEALDILYEELERIQTQYGPWALHTGNVGWRSVGQVHSCGNHMLRAIGMHGRSVGTAGDYSTGAGQVIMPYVLGSTEVYSQGTSWEIILQESKLVIFWANDPIKNLQVGWNTETHEAYAYFEQLKGKVANKEIRVICLDPVKSKTQNFLQCEHQYINPMTDVAMMLAIAHTLWKEDLHDKEFLETYTMGFEGFVPYLAGETEDLVEKTPEWAEPICGVPAERIRELARLMAANRTQLVFGWAIQRQQHGEQPYWMGAIIAAMLGQIGLPGGGISYSHHYSSVGVSSSGAATDPEANFIRTGNVGEFVDAVRRLEEKLRADPDDLHSQLMLARSYRAMGRYEDSVAAFGKAWPLIKDQPTEIAIFAGVLAIYRGGFAGKPDELIAQALALDAENHDALTLAGGSAAQKGDLEGALRHWRKLDALLQDGSEEKQWLAEQIAEVRRKMENPGSGEPQPAVPLRSPHAADPTGPGMGLPSGHVPVQ